jgi:hypothetical protein
MQVLKHSGMQPNDAFGGSPLPAAEKALPVVSSLVRPACCISVSCAKAPVRLTYVGKDLALTVALPGLVMRTCASEQVQARLQVLDNLLETTLSNIDFQHTYLA